MLNREGLKNYFIIMNEKTMAKDLKGREITEEWMNKAWPCFNGYDLKTEGVTKEILLQCLFEIELAED